MTDITLDMNGGEAILVLGAIDKAATAAFVEWRRLMETTAPLDEQEAAKVVGQILSRVSAKLSNDLYPECSWMEECEMLAVGMFRGQGPYCKFHLGQLEGRAAASVSA